MTPRASSPYAVLIAISTGCLLLIVVGFAVGGYTREAVVALGLATALIVVWAVRS